MAPDLLTALILFAVAAAFLAAELFVPSHGVLGAICVVFAIGGVVFAYRANEMLGLIAALLAIICSPIVFYWAIRLYPQTAVGKRVLLHKPKTSTMAGFDEEVTQLHSLIGKRGLALTPLRPAGACEFEDQRIDAMSESTIIDAGATVEVIRVIGLKVLVKEVPAEAPAGSNP